MPTPSKRRFALQGAASPSTLFRSCWVFGALFVGAHPAEDLCIPDHLLPSALPVFRTGVDPGAEPADPACLFAPENH